MYENELVGRIVLTDIEPRPKNYHHFEVTFTLDINGLLDVLVKHRETGREFRDTFERSTEIGQTSRLTEVRAELLELYGMEHRGPGATEPPSTEALPDPLIDD